MSGAGGGAGLVFPASDICLWDRRAVGEPVQACVDGNCWVCLRVSQSALLLAVRASRQTRSTPLHCLLLGTAFVSKRGGVVVEVDRFDVGRRIDYSLIPTALVPGDVVIHCTVGPETTAPLPDSLAQTHLLRTVEAPIVSLQPANLLYFHVHIATDAAYHSNTSISLSCQCVYPDAYTLTPVLDLDIVPTALARNLAGPLALPVLQDTVKWGYLTIEVTRKLVLLLNTDPKSVCIPLVGVWVSGVNGYSHPAVWASILHYTHAKLGKRDSGVGLCLIYSSCCSHPCLFEFQKEDILDRFTSSTLLTEVQLNSDFAPLSLELIPCRSLPLSSSEHSPSASDFVNFQQQRSDAPLPSPLPVLARDTQLSCVSLMDRDTSALSPSACKPVTLPITGLPRTTVSCQGKQLHTVQPEVCETGTNTGMSLLQQAPISSVADCVPGEVTIGASVPGEVSVTTSDPGEVTIRTETSIQPSEPINLDLHSFATSTLHGRNTSDRSEECSMGTNQSAEPFLFHCDKQQFYQKMIDQVQEMLQNSPEYGDQDTTHPVSSGCNSTTKELSVFPVPHILNTVPTYMESTLDEAAHAADIITKKYIGQTEDRDETYSDTAIQDDEVTPNSISIATNRYLQRHRLLPPQCTAQVLDVEKLRAMPKLI